jgi:hypothetical protein
MSSFVRNDKKKVSAPPDFLEPQFRADYSQKSGKLGLIGKAKEIPKDIKTYDAETIMRIREDLESYVKPLHVVRIWRRKTRKAIVYNIEDIKSVNDEDESWILPYDVVKIQRRKARETVTVVEEEHE